MLVLCWLPRNDDPFRTLWLISLARQSIWLRRLRRIDDDDWVKPGDDCCKNTQTSAADCRFLVRCNVHSNSGRSSLSSPGGSFELANLEPESAALYFASRTGTCKTVRRFDPVAWSSRTACVLVQSACLARGQAATSGTRLASDDCVLLSGQTASDYAENTPHVACYRPIRSEIGVAMAHAARLDQRVLAILDPQRRRDPVGSRFAIILPCVVGIGCGVLGAITLSTHAASANPAVSRTVGPAQNASREWKENYTVEYPGTLPVSVAFSADGKTLLTGDTGGEIMAVELVGDEPRWRWKSKIEGSHATVAFSADQNKVYATTEHGVRILDAASGKEEARIEEKDSNPTAIGVFPVRSSPRTSPVARSCSVPLADTSSSLGSREAGRRRRYHQNQHRGERRPAGGRRGCAAGGRSEWPQRDHDRPHRRDGRVGRREGENVLWAYVCGNYEKDSPGNRVLVGHTATVVSAAWAKEGGTAVTGDDAGRVIVWDAKTMREPVASNSVVV